MNKTYLDRFHTKYIRAENVHKKLKIELNLQ